MKQKALSTNFNLRSAYLHMLVRANELGSSVGLNTGVRSEIKSSLKDHAECTGHIMYPRIMLTLILEKTVDNMNKRTFLELLHSVLDDRSVNEHTDFPAIYIPLVESCDEINNI